MTRDRDPNSLRSLAKRLGVTHSALHTAVHGQRLTEGVELDANGIVRVTDPDAAAAQWARVHVDRVDQWARKATAAKLARDPVVTDHHGLEWRGSELLQIVEGLSLLVMELLADGAPPGIADRLRARTQYPEDVRRYALNALEEHEP